MKAATGELNLTVITLIAIGAVIAFFWFMWDHGIKDSVQEQWDGISDSRDRDEGSYGRNGGGGFIVIDDYIANFSK